MCGIIGQWNFDKKPINPVLFRNMRDTLFHRGPDGEGEYFTLNNSFALGHRRLAIVDLSEKASQPLCNEDKTIWLSCNGEIYNYPELKKELQQLGHIFKSDSDSEAIIHGYEQWGTEVLQKLNGMWAFGLWDENKQQLFLARDRFGIKPLYYFLGNEKIIFASEIKAILEDSEIERIIDFKSFCNYFTYRYVPSPSTIWKSIYKIPPATFLTINSNKKVTEKKYWEIRFHNIIISEDEAIKNVNLLIEKSIKEHIMSDVPIGSFLSGGYDSSAIIYYLSKIKYKPQTFTIGFENWEKSEHQYAQIVADKFGLNLTTEIINENSFDQLQKLTYYYDEPIADISIIPTYNVSKSASLKVKVALSGEGADEIFGGYTWHNEKPNSYNLLDRLKYLKTGKKKYNVSEYSDAMAMGYFARNDLQDLLTAHLHKNIPQNPFWFYEDNFINEIEPLKRFQYLDIKTFMGELVLTKVDRASMANSLEVRVPFLDHNIAEYILNLNPEVYFKMKIKKYLLYENIKQSLPETILNRPKQGFTGPDKYYMNFKKYSDIILNGQLIQDNIINKNTILKYLNNFDQWRLWKVAVMEKWYSQWVIK